MFVLIGLAALAASIILGFTMHGGKLAALNQISEFIIIGGAGFSSMLAASSFKKVASVFKDTLGLMKPDPYDKSSYIELLGLLYEISDVSRKGGLLALESHIERPEESELIQNCKSFASNTQAVSFLCDSLRLTLMGGVGTFELQEMMEGDIDVYAEQVKVNPQMVAKVGDAMPGFGIVAAVLGVVITMQAIGGRPEEVGEKVGAALVGTFLGVLLSYGVFGPIAQALDGRAESGVRYLTCLKAGLMAFAQGMAPILVVEFARRNIDGEVRPGFQEIEDIVRGRSSTPEDVQLAA